MGRSSAAPLHNLAGPESALGRTLLLLLVALVGGLFSALGWLGAFFALFFLLALLDDFWLGWRCAFGCHFGRLLFFDLERDDVRDDAILVGDQLDLLGIHWDFARTERLVEGEAADVGAEFRRDVTWQAFDFNFAFDDFEHAALDLHAARIAERVNWNLDAHANVHGDAEEIDMEQAAGDGIDEPVFENGRLMLAAEIDLKEGVVAALRAEDCANLFGIDRERERFALAAVQHGGNFTSEAEAAGFVFAASFAVGCFDYDFCLSHLAFPS